MLRNTLARARLPMVALLCCVAAQALALLAETVDIDSATENHAGVRKVGDVLVARRTRGSC